MNALEENVRVRMTGDERALADVVRNREGRSLSALCRRALVRYCETEYPELAARMLPCEPDPRD